MSDAIPPIARIGVARSLPRLAALPVVLVLIGTAAAAGAWRAGGPIAIGLAVVGLGLMLLALAVAVVLFSMRAEVDETGIHLRWPGGERIYPLARGAVTRVVLQGANASSLRPAIGAFGWAIGSARLRETEAVDVLLLAATRTAIVVPTERNRLVIAVTDEQELLTAVTTAARARQRLDELRRAVPSVRVAAPAPEPPALTGIELAEREARLEAERAAGERLSVGPVTDAARAAISPVATAGTVPEAVAHQGGAVEAATEVSRLRGIASRVGVRRPAVVRRPHPGARAVAIAAPLVVAGAVWGVMTLTGRVPDLDQDRLRLASLALVLAGPGATLGAIMARIWWPRLVGLVAVTAFCVLVIVGRALLVD